jgi:sulfur transfer protein SufE
MLFVFNWRMSKVFIYSLLDPLDGRIRYIGKSIRPKERLQNHMNEISNCHRSHWLQSLKKKGLKPEMRILEELEHSENWQQREKHWIKIGRSLGWPLTNNTNGGDGVEGLPPETRERMRKVWLGRKHSPETLIKLSKASKGRKHSEASKQRMRQLMEGRKITWGAKISEATAKLTDADCEQILKDMKNGIKGCLLAEKYGVHRTTISKVKMGTYKPKLNANAGLD